MLSRTIEYALRAMTCLGALGLSEALNSESIAERTRVPRGYLSKVLRDLVVAGLVVSRRGPNGGFSLARAPGAITLLDVVHAVDPIVRMTRCPLGNSEHLALCPLHHRLDEAAAHVEREFQRTTLGDILESNSRAAGGERDRCAGLALRQSMERCR